MKRHKWKKGSKDLINKFTEQEKCIVCGLFRFKAMGSWMYSNEKTTDDYPFVDTINNIGCLDSYDEIINQKP